METNVKSTIHVSYVDMTLFCGDIGFKSLSVQVHIIKFLTKDHDFNTAIVCQLCKI